jgi:putative ABC transport system permease protein
MLTFFAKLARGHFRRHRLEALLCLVGVALGVAVVVSIDSAVAACVGSFQGAVNTLAERSTHSIFAKEGVLADADYLGLARKGLGAPMAPMIDRGVLVQPTRQAARAFDEKSAFVARLIGVDVFSEKSLRSFTNMKSTLDETAFRRFLTEPNTVVLVDELAARLSVRPGDSIVLTANDRRAAVTVVGVTHLSGVARSQLGDLVIADLATAQELTGLVGRLDRIDLNLSSPEQERAVVAALPDTMVLRSTQQQSTSLSDLIASYKLNLNSLSLMASFVAVFIVYNAMLISVQQRSASLGILRCLGSSRGQLAGLYLLEALAFAVVGGVLGVLGGWGLSRILVGYISTTINDLYATLRPGVVALDASMFGKGLAVSVASCLVGAAIPLWRASRTPPVNVFRATAAARDSLRTSTRSLFFGVALLVSSWAVYALPGRSPVVGFVMALLIALGFALVCPAMTRLACRCVDRAARPAQFLPAQMAAAGVARSLGITGVAVAAMMLAMAMNVGVRTMVASFRGALGDWMERRFAADVFIGPELLVNHKIDATIDPGVREWVTRQPEVAGIVDYRATTADVAGKSTMLVATDMAELLGGRFPIKSVEGGGRTFDPARDVLISEPLAGRMNLSAGDDIALDTPTGRRTFHVHAVFFDFGSERGQVIVDRPTYAAAWRDPTITSLHVRLKGPSQGDASPIAARWAAELRKTYPVVVNSFGHVKAEVLAVFDRTFKVTDVLTWLAGGVAFCGLGGSLLALSLARRRDYSVLAAVGMSARQTAAWVLGQGLLIAWTSAAVAAVAGTVLAYVLSYVIQYRSFGWSIPTSPQPRFWVEAFLIATVAAIVAAVYPVYRLRRTAPAVSLREE